MPTMRVDTFAGSEREAIADHLREEAEHVPAPPAPPAGEGGWYDNLVERVGETEVTRIGNDLIEEIDAERRSREPWIKALAEGKKRLGLDTTDVTRNDPFAGASAATMPVLAQAAIDFQANASAALIPASGPVRTALIGEPSPELLERSTVLQGYYNWQLLKLMREWRAETEKNLMMLPFEGSGFAKLWWCSQFKRPRRAYLPHDQIIVSYFADSIDTAPLVAHQLRYMPWKARRLVDEKLWAPHPITAGEVVEQSPLERQRDKDMGQQLPAHERDSASPLIYYEAATTRRINGLDGEEWLVTVNKDGRVVSLRRNWREDDDLRMRNRRIVHYGMFPWDGFYHVGLLHWLGRLDAAATGSLRALLDSAQISNVQGWLKLERRGRASGQTLRLDPMRVHPIEASPGVDDIRKIMMAWPTKEPSSVLFQLLGMLGEAGGRFASVLTQQIADSKPETPVGTMLALIEQGSKVYSAIHARLHHQQMEEFEILRELNVENVDDLWLIRRVGGRLQIRADDLSLPIDLVPAGNPNDFSQIQSVMKAQAQIQMAQQAANDGVEVNMRAAYVLAAQAMRLKDADKVFPEAEVFSGDPYAEAHALLRGAALQVQPDQNHELHISAHVAMLQLPTFLSSPPGQKLLPHTFDHFRQWVAQAAAAAIRKANMLPTPGEAEPEEGVEVEAQDGPPAAEMEELVAKALEQSEQAFQLFISLLQNLAPAMQPQDPGMALAQAEQSKVEAKREEVDQRIRLEREQMQLNVQEALAKIQASLEATLAKAIASVTMAREGNASRERITAAQLAADAVEAATKAVPGGMDDPEIGKPKGDGKSSG